MDAPATPATPTPATPAESQPRGPRRLGASWFRRRVALLVVAAALLAAEQVWFFTHSETPARPRIASSATASLMGRVSALVASALGPSDRGVRRFQITSLPLAPGSHGQHSVSLSWAINGDLSLGSVSAGAQLEVFLVLRTLYTAHLPVTMVRMTGTFGQQDRRGRDVEVPVMIVGLNAATARLIDWQNMDASTVWPLLHRYMVRPGFDCQCQE